MNSYLRNITSRWIPLGLIPCLLFASLLLAQEGRPTPARPASQAPVGNPQDAQRQTSPPGPLGGVGRRDIDDRKITFGFKDVAITDMIEWIADLTGKVVIPVRPQTLQATKITLIKDEFISKNEALDLLFTAFRLNGVGVIETEDVIIISSLDEIGQNPDLPVIPAKVSIKDRLDRGTVVIKIFPVVNRNAEGIFTQIEETKPSYVSISLDVDSNQLVVMGDIGYCQQVQHIIDELDKKWVIGETRTFRLAHADAQEIADNILELFETSTSSQVRPQSRATRGGARQQPRGRQSSPTTISPSSAGPVVEMQVTVNIQQNTVTIRAEHSVIEDIQKLIQEEWDLPRPETTTKVYALKYSDPIKIRDTLQQLLGTSGGGSQGRSATGRPTAGGAVGGGAATNLGNIYRIEAFPDQNSIIVLGKSPESFDFLDDMIAKLDQPSDIGLPLIIELNHADAVELSEELNALLQEAGAGLGLEVEGRGLSGQGLSDSGGGGAGGTGGAVGREAEGARELQFPWQRGRQDEQQSPESPMIGKIRIMPIVRQNALAILCPISQREAIKQLIATFDRPGRQVMISAIIAEVELTDDFALGLRVSSAALSLTNIDNALSAGINVTGQNNDFLSNLFNTSTLDFNLSANAVIQALSQLTKVRILQEPVVYTSDNQEAYFFDGQDVPFINNSNTTDTGGITQSFEYKQVGVVLNVRPRITAQNDVNMEIYLELSSIVPGVTLFGGAIIDRRSTTTEITVKSGQTIIISGILRESESTITRKVPFLGDIPIIGELFKSKEKRMVTSELVAFITPVVIENPSLQEVLSDENRRLLEELSRPIDEQTDRTEDIRKRIIDPPIIPRIIDPTGSGVLPKARDIRDDTGRKKRQSGRGH